MSKKSKRPKLSKDKLIRILHSEQQISEARTQMLQNDFAGAITTCQRILSTLPLRIAQQVEVLAFLGLAHSMLHHYEQSYDAITQALTLDPTNALLWYNRSLACHYTTRFGQAFRDCQRAVALQGTISGEIAQKFARELKSSRQLAQDAMKLRGKDFTLDQLIEQDEHFQRGLRLMQANNAEESEQAFRRVIEMGGCLAPQWGNLGVCLLMLQRYDEAEEALKQALAIDPEYPIAKDNLAKIPEIRQAGGPLGVVIRNALEESESDQTLTFYENIYEDSLTVMSVGHAQQDNAQCGELPPLYRFFLNPYRDARFTSCPGCGSRTLQRMLPLLIQVDSGQAFALNKSCRYCPNCDLLILHQDELEKAVTSIYPLSEKKSYRILGTLHRTRWRRNLHRWTTLQELSPQMTEALYNFKEITTFKRMD